MASYLYYVRGLKVLVVDYDYPQYSIKEMRDRDVEILRINSAFKKNFYGAARTHTETLYPILITKPEDALDRARAIIESGKGDYDIVLFDLPGTINNPGVPKTVS